MPNLKKANKFKTILRARQDANNQDTFSTVYSVRTSKPILGEMSAVEAFPGNNPYDQIDVSTTKVRFLSPPSLCNYKSELFGLAAKSTSELHSLRRRLARVYHPDANEDQSREWAQIVMSEINSAIDAALDAEHKHERPGQKDTKK